MSEEISNKILKEVYPQRRPEAHKYDFGHLLVIGGSKLYSGSPAFNALAAYRTGVDLVTVVAPRRAADIIASFSPDLITYPIEGDFFTPKHLHEVNDLLNGKDAVVVGGGMGREFETLEFIRQFLMGLNTPAVIDADALHAVEGKGAYQESAEASMFEGKNFILTPHAHEFYILTGRELPTDEVKRADIVREAAAGLETIILTKGSPDIVSDGTRVALNRTGNPYLTVGGTGDTLAGICGAYLTFGLDPFTAACAAAFVNGRAGDLAAEELGAALMATDLLDYLPQALSPEQQRINS